MGLVNDQVWLWREAVPLNKGIGAVATVVGAITGLDGSGFPEYPCGINSKAATAIGTGAATLTALGRLQPSG